MRFSRTCEEAVRSDEYCENGVRKKDTSSFTVDVFDLFTILFSQNGFPCFTLALKNPQFSFLHSLAIHAYGHNPSIQ